MVTLFFHEITFCQKLWLCVIEENVKMFWLAVTVKHNSSR